MPLLRVKALALVPFGEMFEVLRAANYVVRALGRAVWLGIKTSHVAFNG